MSYEYLMFSRICYDLHETLGEGDYVMMFTYAHDTISLCYVTKYCFQICSTSIIMLLCYFCYMFNEVSTPFGKGITHLRIVAPLSFVMLSGSFVFVCVNSRRFGSRQAGVER
jgi:hypothetical protein